MNIIFPIIAVSVLGFFFLAIIVALIEDCFNIDIKYNLKQFYRRIKQLKFKQMKMKYLAQALRFACLPTLAVLLLLFFGFFSIDKTMAFISSDNGWAIGLRVILVIAEIGLVYVMYNEFEEKGEIEERRKKAGIDVDEVGKILEYNNPVYQLVRGWNHDDEYKAYKKEGDIVLIQRTPKAKK